MTYKGLPLYDLVSNSEEERMLKISLVDDPAVEVDFLCFRNEEGKKMRFSTDELQHKITGCAIWAGKPIYRVIDDTECYVRFTKEYIEELVERYSKDGNWNLVNLQHNDDENVEGIVMTEFFIKDTEKGISPKGFEEVSDGSLFVTFHITDDKLWDEIYNGDKLNGFSIEVLSSLKPTTVEVVEVEDDGLEDFFDDLLNSLFVQERDVREYIDDRRIVNITTSDGRTFEGQIYSVGKTNGMRSAIIQNNENLTWENILLEDIERIEQTERELVAWERQAPTFKDILDNDDITTEKTISAPITTVQEALENNKVMMLNYYDEENSDGRGSRQVIIAHYGFTKRGNEMFIAYQYYGSSHSDPAGRGIWRTFLTKRVVSLQEIPNMEPVYEAPIGFTDNPSPECGTIFETATFLY